MSFMRNYNLVLTVLFAMSFCLQAVAQDDKTSVPMTTVTPQRSSPLGADKVMLQGVIKDVKGEPLPGANVYVRETKGGAVADIDGRFTVALP